MNESDHPAGGWQVGQSLALELDLVLAALRTAGRSGIITPEIEALSAALPTDWLAEWDDLLGRPRSSLSLLEYLAFLAGTWNVGEYRSATLGMRSLSVPMALSALTEMAAPYGLAADPQRPAPERLIDLGTRLTTTLYTALGFQAVRSSRLVQDNSLDWEHLARILPGGDLHERFWMWLDRFYYESYAPWREAQAQHMDALEKQAATILGAPCTSSGAPNTTWLPTRNPLLCHPELLAAVQAGHLRVFFWVEPFGIGDVWSLLPGWVAVSFCEPGAGFQNFLRRADDLATRAQALADPTRLVILRLIRHFGMINTEIAAYLGISRPTVSVHAGILRQAGLIRSSPEGRQMRHEVVPGETQRLFRELEAFLDLPTEENA